MPATLDYNQSETSNNLFAWLHTGDKVIVEEGVVLNTNYPLAFLSADNGNGDNITMQINGVVNSTVGLEGIGNHVIIGAHGGIMGSDGIAGETGGGLELGMSSSTLDNAGYIIGQVAGVWLGPQWQIPHDGTSTINNSGQILAEQNGIYRHDHDLEKLIVNNTGDISGHTFSFNSGGANAEDDIYNAGRMFGDVKLDGGDDMFDTHLGQVNGKVLLGNGNDVYIGSAFNDTVDGGRGHDMLTGNAGADTFVFNSALDSATGKAADIITDFSHREHDIIDLHTIDANSHGFGNQAFSWIGGHDFHHKAGELNYTIVNGNAFVSGDINGDGKADFTIELDHVTSLTASDFIL